MESETDEVVLSCVHAEKLNVQHMGEPRQRLPVADMHAERPPDIVPGDALLNPFVLRDVDAIIKGHEGMVTQGKKHPHDARKQEQAKGQSEAKRRH